MQNGESKLKRKKTKNSGFSLIEMLVALAVFTLIIGGVTLFSIRTIQSHTRSQAMQTAIENAQFAIEGLNKKIRTSNNAVGSWGGDSVFIVDNVDSTAYCYYFDTTNEKLMVKKGADDGSDTKCSDIDPTASELVGGADIKATGSFYVKETDEDVDKRGLVTTVITITYDPNSSNDDPYQQDSFTIQSTVSLRDYGMNN